MDLRYKKSRFHVEAAFFMRKKKAYLTSQKSFWFKLSFALTAA
jgi:hypothetical protein